MTGPSPPRAAGQWVKRQAAWTREDGDCCRQAAQRLRRWRQARSAQTRGAMPSRTCCGRTAGSTGAQRSRAWTAVRRGADTVHVQFVLGAGVNRPEWVQGFRAGELDVHVRSVREAADDTDGPKLVATGEGFDRHGDVLRTQRGLERRRDRIRLG